MNSDDSPYCPSCKKNYVLKTREPYLLSCLHSVCRQCLTSQVQADVIQCSICKADDRQTAGCYTDHVTRNELIMHVSRYAPQKLHCTNKLDGQTGKIFCFECNHFLCDDCSNYHAQLESTKNHASIATGKLSTVPLSEWKTKQKCHSHPDYPVVFYCKETTCKKLICLFCLSKDHSGHDTQEIDEACEEEKQRLKKISQLLQDRILVLKGLQAHQQKVNVQRKRIRETFQNLRATIRERHQTQRQILEYRDREQREKFEAAINRIQARLNKLKSFYEHSVAFYATPEFKSIESSSIEMPEPKTSDTELVFVQIGLVNLLEDVRSFGNVKSSLAESKC